MMLVCLAASPSAVCAQAQPTPPPAAPEPSYPTVSVGGLTYIQYDAELENRDGYNAFDVTRGYINITGDLAKNIKYRMTPDVRRLTDGGLAGSMVFRVKYAYVEFDNVVPHSWLRLGAHQTPWLDFEESINRYRVQGTVFSEREGVIPSSADVGLGYLQQLPGSYGEINAGVYNGEGVNRPDANKYKSVQARVTARPLPAGEVAKGLRLSAFYDWGWFDGGRPRRHGIVMASFEHSHLVATAQWLTATERPAPLITDVERRGYSTFLELRQGLEGWAGLLRFERFDPDTGMPSNSHRRTILGVAYWLLWSKVRIGFVVDDEDVRYDVAANAPDENRLLFQTHVQF